MDQSILNSLGLAANGTITGMNGAYGQPQGMHHPMNQLLASLHASMGYNGPLAWGNGFPVPYLPPDYGLPLPPSAFMPPPQYSPLQYPLMQFQSQGFPFQAVPSASPPVGFPTPQHIANAPIQVQLPSVSPPAGFPAPQHIANAPIQAQLPSASPPAGLPAPHPTCHYIPYVLEGAHVPDPSVIQTPRSRPVDLSRKNRSHDSVNKESAVAIGSTSTGGTGSEVLSACSQQQPARIGQDATQAVLRMASTTEQGVGGMFAPATNSTGGSHSTKRQLEEAVGRKARKVCAEDVTGAVKSTVYRVVDVVVDSEYVNGIRAWPVYSQEHLAMEVENLISEIAGDEDSDSDSTTDQRATPPPAHVERPLSQMDTRGAGTQHDSASNGSEAHPVTHIEYVTHVEEPLAVAQMDTDRASQLVSTAPVLMEHALADSPHDSGADPDPVQPLLQMSTYVEGSERDVETSSVPPVAQVDRDIPGMVSGRGLIQEPSDDESEDFPDLRDPMLSLAFEPENRIDYSPANALGPVPVSDQSEYLIDQREDVAMDIPEPLLTPMASEDYLAVKDGGRGSSTVHSDEQTDVASLLPPSCVTEASEESLLVKEGGPGSNTVHLDEQMDAGALSPSPSVTEAPEVESAGPPLTGDGATPTPFNDECDSLPREKEFLLPTLTSVKVAEVLETLWTELSSDRGTASVESDPSEGARMAASGPVAVTPPIPDMPGEQLPESEPFESIEGSLCLKLADTCSLKNDVVKPTEQSAKTTTLVPRASTPSTLSSCDSASAPQAPGVNHEDRVPSCPPGEGKGQTSLDNTMVANLSTTDLAEPVQPEVAEDQMDVGAPSSPTVPEAPEVESVGGGEVPDMIEDSSSPLLPMDDVPSESAPQEDFLPTLSSTHMLEEGLRDLELSSDFGSAIAETATLPDGDVAGSGGAAAGMAASGDAGMGASGGAAMAASGHVALAPIPDTCCAQPLESAPFEAIGVRVCLKRCSEAKRAGRSSVPATPVPRALSPTCSVSSSQGIKKRRKFNVVLPSQRAGLRTRVDSPVSLAPRKTQTQKTAEKEARSCSKDPTGHVARGTYTAEDLNLWSRAKTKARVDFGAEGGVQILLFDANDEQIGVIRCLGYDPGTDTELPGNRAFSTQGAPGQVLSTSGAGAIQTTSAPQQGARGSGTGNTAEAIQTAPKWVRKLAPEVAQGLVATATTPAEGARRPAPPGQSSVQTDRVRPKSIGKILATEKRTATPPPPETGNKSIKFQSYLRTWKQKGYQTTGGAFLPAMLLRKRLQPLRPDLTGSDDQAKQYVGGTSKTVNPNRYVALAPSWVPMKAPRSTEFIDAVTGPSRKNPAPLPSAMRRPIPVPPSSKRLQSITSLR